MIRRARSTQPRRPSDLLVSRRASPASVPAARVTSPSRRQRALTTLVVSLKFVVPSLTLRFPFAGAWGNYVLDVIDGDVLLELGVPEETYQTIDKAADFYSYVVMLIVGLRWRIKHLIVLLFVYRTVGQALFFRTRNERAFVAFPNFLEPLVMIYTFLLFRHQGRESQAYAAYRRHAVPIWLAIVAYKLWNEWSLHVANIDLSERVFGFTGGASEPGRPPRHRDGTRPHSRGFATARGMPADNVGRHATTCLPPQAEGASA